MITQEQINKAFPGKSKYPQDIQFYQKLDCSFISLTVEKAGLLLRPEEAYWVWAWFSKYFYCSWYRVEGRDILNIVESYISRQNDSTKIEKSSQKNESFKKTTINYRVYSKKLKMFTDDARWPSNQRTWPEFVVTPDGEVVEFITTDGENFFKMLCDQEDFEVTIKEL